MAGCAVTAWGEPQISWTIQSFSWRHYTRCAVPGASQVNISPRAAFALSRKAPFIFLFVRLSAYINSAPIGRILVKFMSNTFVKICWSNADLIQTNSMEQSPSWEANRTSASQDIARILWSPDFHHRIYKSPPLKSDHFTKTQGFWQCWGQHKSDIKSVLVPNCFKLFG
jgi:hypothetical protein